MNIQLKTALNREQGKHVQQITIQPQEVLHKKEKNKSDSVLALQWSQVFTTVSLKA